MKSLVKNGESTAVFKFDNDWKVRKTRSKTTQCYFAEFEFIAHLSFALPLNIHTIVASIVTLHNLKNCKIARNQYGSIPSRTMSLNHAPKLYQKHTFGSYCPLADPPTHSICGTGADLLPVVYWPWCSVSVVTSVNRTLPAHSVQTNLQSFQILG